MALEEKQIQETKTAGDDFLKLCRPPIDIRNQLDLFYRIEDQSVIVFEIRPCWDDPSEIMEPCSQINFYANTKPVESLLDTVRFKMA